MCADVSCDENYSKHILITFQFLTNFHAYKIVNIDKHFLYEIMFSQNKMQTYLIKKLFTVDNLR